MNLHVLGHANDQVAVFWSKKIRNNRWLNFGLVNIHKAEKKEMTEKDIIIYFHCYSLQPWQALLFCLNLMLAVFFF